MFPLKTFRVQLIVFLLAFVKQHPRRTKLSINIKKRDAKNVYASKISTSLDNISQSQSVFSAVLVCLQVTVKRHPYIHFSRPFYISLPALTFINEPSAKNTDLGVSFFKKLNSCPYMSSKSTSTR
jgi:hypothetical protein